MNVILVSGRYEASSWSIARHDEDAEFAARLAAADCSVRWIVSAASAREPVGVRVVPVRSPAPGFKAVEAGLRDRFTEGVLAREIRSELPAVVHLLDYGRSTSVNVSWVANRLGVPVVVGAHAAPTLCHRGDLVHADGIQCAEWSDPRRCAACCVVPASDGLTPSRFCRFLLAVRWPFHPYPTPAAFENRRELVAGGLQIADVIVAPSGTDRDRIASLGLRPEQFEILESPAVEDWLAVYERASRT